MSNPQTTAIQGQAGGTRLRPVLDLGPMGGDQKYIRARAEDLIRTFEAILDAKIELVNDNRGYTDCQTMIAAPVDEDDEAYLTTEHELSHWLFETDLEMTKTFVDYTAGRILQRAGFKPGTDDARPYQKHLSGIVHALWNIVEDWRCCWLWGELYAGGAELLQQRWHDISKFEIPDKAAEQSLVTYLARKSAGVPTLTAPPEFQSCDQAMQRALNLVEGVGPAACLGIVGILLDEILDELLANNPPPPPPPPAGQSGGQSGSSPGKKVPAKKRQGSSRRLLKQQRQKESEHTLHLLCNMVPRKGPGSNSSKPAGKGGLGEADLKASPKKKRGSSGLGSIKRIINANSDSSDETGMTPFQFLLHDEAVRMQDRLAEARKAMMKNHDTSEQEQAQLLLGSAKLCGIEIQYVNPLRPLPPPSPVAYENRKILEQLRMKKRRRKSEDGNFNPGAFLNALGQGQLDQPFHDKHVRIPQFELLFLFDASGSMTLGQALPLTERALADSVFAVQAIRSKAHMWAFSDVLYVFNEVGSVYAPGIRHGSTSMVQALDVAQRWARKDVRKRALMLVTDGWPTSCRAERSTGNPLGDLRSVLDEIRADKIALSVLGIRSPSQTAEDAAKMYDQAFGERGYGAVGTFDDLSTELPKAVRVLASTHIAKGNRR
jgi:hypothetical protein